MKPIKKITPWIMLIIGAMFYSYEFFLRVSPSVLTKDLMQTFNITARELGLLSSYYFWAYTPMQVFVGVLMDHYRIKKLLILASAACTIGAYLFFAKHSFMLSGIGRFSIGFGSAFAFVAVMKIASEWLPNKYFSLVSGFSTSLGMLGAIGGEFVLSKFIKTLGYESSVAIILASGIVITILIGLFIKNKTVVKHKNNLSNELYMLRSSIIDVAKNKQIWVCATIGACLYMPTTFFAGQWAIPYFIDVYHMSHIDAAYISSAMFAGWIIGSPIMGFISNAINKRNPLLVTGAIIALFCSLILLYSKPNLDMTLIIMFIMGFASSSQILVFAIAHEISKTSLTATAVALTNMVIMFGGFIQQLVGKLLDFSSPNPNIAYNLHDYHIALSIMPICFITGGFLCLFLHETFCKIQNKN